MRMRHLIPLLLPLPALAQETFFTPAATQPSVGHFALRERLVWFSLGDDPSPREREGDELVATTTIAYGLTRDWSLWLDAPVVWRSEQETIGSARDSDELFGLGDMSLTAKYRFFQHDLGPVDTIRAAAIAGFQAPTGTGDLSSHSWDPIFGGVFMLITGRHGLTQSLVYQLNTGTIEDPWRAGGGKADLLRYDTAWAFRFHPVEYTADTRAAWYAVVELNGMYETNGDNEVMLSPGVLIEARTWALETTIQIPIAAEVDHRPEVELAIGLDFRLVF
jgi:hypothetical protein